MPCGVCPKEYALRGMPCGACPAGYALQGMPCGVCPAGYATAGFACPAAAQVPQGTAGSAAFREQFRLGVRTEVSSALAGLRGSGGTLLSSMTAQELAMQPTPLLQPGARRRRTGGWRFFRATSRKRGDMFGPCWPLPLALRAQRCVQQCAPCWVHLCGPLSLLSWWAGTCCSDHGPGIMAGFRTQYPDVPWVGCWEHVAWHYTHGRYLDVAHPMYYEVQDMLAELHTCHTTGMWDVLVHCMGRLLDDSDARVRRLWNSILVAPCNRWHLGVSRTPAACPSQQVQEVHPRHPRPATDSRAGPPARLPCTPLA